MTGFHSLALAAAVAASVIVPTVVPAVADQNIEKLVVRSPVPRHHAFQANRRAIMHAYPATHVAAIPADVACSSLWCGREFVLMLGVGF